MVDDKEKKLQETFPWQRSKYHTDYNQVLGFYKVKSCLDNAVGNTLLDIACGDGMLTQMFAQHFKVIVGVDASSKHLAEARKRVPSGEFHESLIEDFEYNRKFDSVFMLDLLEHVQDPQAVLEKAASFLNPQGCLIVHVPNCDAVNRKISVLMGTLESCDELSPFDLKVAGHRRSYNLQSLKREITDAGLKVLKTGGIFYKMLSTPQMDWFLKNGLWESGHGWGRTGMETAKDWKAEFCRACYEYGLEHPEDCNIIYACIGKNDWSAVPRAKARGAEMSLNKEHQQLVEKNIAELTADTDVQALSRVWSREANRYGYTYNFTWLGRPIIQYPQDMAAMQELIWKVKPDLVIEAGIAHGGSLIMSASLLALLDYCEAVEAETTLDPQNSRRRVLGLDIDIRSHNRAAIESHPLSHKIDMIEGSSIDPDIIAKVRDYAGKYERVLVCLDSMHTHDHVLAELEAYAPLVSSGSYCVVFDTLIEDMPADLFADRPWGPGNNPKTAVREYLRRLKEEGRTAADGAPLHFEIDRTIEHKLLITVAPEGYLKRL